jgi:hypothetical protein
MKHGNIHSQNWVMEAVVVEYDRLNLTKYQLNIPLPPHKSTVFPKLKMMWTIESSLMRVMEAVVIQFYMLNLTRYQLQVPIPPRIHCSS